MAVAAGCLAAAIITALTLVHWAVWRWLAVLAALPVGWLGVAGQVGAGSAAAGVAAGLAVALVAWRAPAPTAAWATGAALALAGVVAYRTAGDDPWRLDTGAWAGLLPCVALALGAAAGLGRAAGSAVRVVCLVAVMVPVVLLVGCERDGVAAVAWWPAAGALGLTGLLRGRRGAAAQRPQLDDVDRRALETFSAGLQRPLHPVVVVIAAYNEADGLPAVVERLPDRECGLPADILVVDDGSTDGTAEVARATGRALVVGCDTNRGQGAALRLGYRIARDHGASYIVTTDADGQYDVADLPAVLKPVVDDRADFVTGSRRLGVQENRDAVRHVGTYVFAWLVSALVGRSLTDTSFGLRAMRADVTAAVTLNQPQYQSSELLIGVLSHGFRVLEVPATMHARSAGGSKKGGNLTYGSRYARVVLSTWWREGCPSPLAESAPALRPSGGVEGGGGPDATDALA